MCLKINSFTKRTFVVLLEELNNINAGLLYYLNIERKADRSGPEVTV